MAGYGDEAFIEVFYAKLGKHYLSPHVDGLRALFKKNTQRRTWPAVRDRRSAEAHPRGTPAETESKGRRIMKRRCNAHLLVALALYWLGAGVAFHLGVLRAMVQRAEEIARAVPYMHEVE